MLVEITLGFYETCKNFVIPEIPQIPVPQERVWKTHTIYVKCNEYGELEESEHVKKAQSKLKARGQRLMCKRSNYLLPSLRPSPLYTVKDLGTRRKCLRC